jgi:hypothetical protein
VLLADQPQLLAVGVIGGSLNDIGAGVHELAMQLRDDLGMLEHHLRDERAGGGTGPTGPSGTTGPTTGSTGSTGSTGTTGAKPRTSPVHLSERLKRRRLTVTVKASRSENVEVSYTARWHGRLLTRRQRAVRVRHGEASTVFVLSQTAARSAKVTVMARTTGQPAVSSTLKRTVAH